MCVSGSQPHHLNVTTSDVQMRVCGTHIHTMYYHRPRQNNRTTLQLCIDVNRELNFAELSGHSIKSHGDPTLLSSNSSEIINCSKHVHRQLGLIINNGSIYIRSELILKEWFGWLFNGVVVCESF